MASAHGVLTAVLSVRDGRIRASVGRTISRINADLLLKRLWIGESDDATVDHLRQVASACGAVPAALLDGLHERRGTAARRLAARRGLVATPVRITPRWRMVVGHGEDTAHETSLTMSPTWGVPIIPGSALKGVAASQARAAHGDPLPDRIARLFGTPRPGESTVDDVVATRGAVTVLDALPVGPPDVVVDVLTPHVKPYYDKDAAKQPKEPPAEYHSPVPVRFLAVAATAFQCWLVGPKGDVGCFAALLQGGADDLGIGGKTAAGYGYCAVEVQQ